MNLKYSTLAQVQTQKLRQNAPVEKEIAQLESLLQQHNVAKAAAVASSGFREAQRLQDEIVQLQRRITELNKLQSAVENAVKKIKGLESRLAEDHAAIKVALEEDRYGDAQTLKESIAGTSLELDQAAPWGGQQTSVSPLQTNTGY